MSSWIDGFSLKIKSRTMGPRSLWGPSLRNVCVLATGQVWAPGDTDTSWTQSLISQGPGSPSRRTHGQASRQAIPFQPSHSHKRYRKQLLRPLSPHLENGSDEGSFALKGPRVGLRGSLSTRTPPTRVETTWPVHSRHYSCRGPALQGWLLGQAGLSTDR